MLMADDRKFMVVDPVSTPPQDILKVVIHLIADMGSVMVSRQAALTHPEDPEAEYNQVMEQVHKLAQHLDGHLVDVVDEETELGVVLLASLQAAVWNMERFISKIEEVKACDHTDCQHRMDGLGGHESVLLDDADDEADEDEPAPINLTGGVRLGRKVRGDH